MLPILLLDDSPKFKVGCIACGIACGILYAVSKTVILKGYEKTSVAFMTLCHASGMILPCLLGHFLWSEKLSVISVIGIVLAIASIVLLKDSQNKQNAFDKIGIICGIIIFATSGGVMIVQKIMGIYFSSQSVSAYNFYSFIVASLILCFFIKPKIVPLKDSKFTLVFAAASGISLSVISLVMTSLAGTVPSIILFPIFNGLGIILVCVGSAFFFKEKLTRKKFFGLLIGVLGLCLVNF